MPAIPTDLKSAIVEALARALAADWVRRQDSDKFEQTAPDRFDDDRRFRGRSRQVPE